MKQYESYKDSGTPWIGQIPSHWEVKRGKFTTAILAGFAFNSDNFTTDEGYMPLIRIRDINSPTTEMNYNGDYPEAYVIRKGDILIGMDGDFNVAEWCGEDALLNQRVCKIEDTKKMSSKFAYYLLPRPLQLLNDVCYATTVKHLSTYDVMGLFLPIPPLDEQTAIVEYLDKKCGSIDKVIATQERRIERLGELKQSIITEAVTRGINPNVPLKDSGIEWIGKIPEHWDLIQLKFAANKANCCFIDGDWIESTDISEEGIRYITTGNVGVLEYKEQGNSFISEDTFERLNCTEVFPGDILISRLNEPIGRSCILPDLGIRVVTSVDNVIFRPNKDLYDKRFLVYYLNCSIFTEHANLEARGSTMHRMSRTMLGHQQTIVPPIAEQTAIAEYLDRKCARIDAAIAKAKREVELLREFKQSVITEAVTGKIKVCKSQHLQL